MNPLQQAAVRRKVYYVAAVLGLFTLSMFWRGTIPVPLSGGGGPGAWLARHTIRTQATTLELTEETGDPEVAGSAVRLVLTGSRGFVVSVLWLSAIEKQKRNDFHEMDVLVRQVTRLQPNFITPWIFQSWNIAYNVSVEQDRLGDMYFYIARGIELLAEGERRNKKSPDMRYQIAFYYQNKFGVSDKVQTLRCLFQLSCIPPNERNTEPGGPLVNPDGSVNLTGFRQFCEKNPHLVRRLRAKLNCRKPEDVVAFLRDNKSVPNRYRNATELADADKQFPALPPKFNEGPEEAHPGSTAGDDFSAFRSARAWYAYSLLLVPPTPTVPEAEAGVFPLPAGHPVPAPSPGPGEFDPFRYRMPRLPMLIIFRQGAPRAQSYQAEWEEKEGWFDAEGWRVDEGVDPGQAWFPGQDVVIGAGRAWALAEWQKAAELWAAHGYQNGQVLTASELAALREIAGDAATLPAEPTAEQRADPGMRRRYVAHLALYYYQQNRSVTNFAYFLAQAQAEAKPGTVAARKTLWKADDARRAGNKLRAIQLYQEGLKLWKQVLLDNPEFHRPERSDRTEEESYEFELEYLRLIAQDEPAVRAKAQDEWEKAFRAVVPALPAAPDIPQSDRQFLFMDVAERFFSPFADAMPNGDPWIRDSVREGVKSRQGVVRQPAGPPPVPTPAVQPGAVPPKPPGS